MATSGSVTGAPKNGSVQYSVADFLRLIKGGAGTEPSLRRADIYLSRRNSLFSYLIRRATGSNFSHVGLVFLVPNVEKGFDQAFVIESVIGGVGIRPLEQKIRENEVMAVLRFEPTWMNEDIRSHVRGHFLNYINSGYRWALIWRYLRAWLFGVTVQFSGAAKRQGRISQAARPRRQLPNSFICSGYIQYAFVAAIENLSRIGLVKLDRAHAIFARGVDPKANDRTLMTITPEDIAQSEQLAWKYVIRRGRVHAVSNREEALALVKGKKPKLVKRGDEDAPPRKLQDSQ